MYSQGGNAYGIFVEHGSEIGTTIIDFNDNTVINAQNANGSGEAVYISGDGVAVNFNKAQKKGLRLISSVTLLQLIMLKLRWQAIAMLLKVRLRLMLAA